MSLTTGSGPLGARPAGRFSVAVPAATVYVEPFRRRVRATIGGRSVVDSERVVLIHRPGAPPGYAFPAGDVDDGLPARPAPEVAGYVVVGWEAVEAWYEELEPITGHPRNPYHRVDCVATAMRLVVEAAGVVVVDTTDTLGVYETALEPRLYVAPGHLLAGRLLPGAARTHCPYKGWASWWDLEVDAVTVRDVAWSYDDPVPEALPLGGLLGFDPDRVTVVADLPAPATW